MNRLRRAALLGLLLLLPAGRLAAATTVTTETLRLTFDARGNLDLAIACFPACSGEGVRLQQFGDRSVIAIEAGGDWHQSDWSNGAHRVLLFEGPDGAALTWRVPLRGYRLELEAAGIRRLTLRSGEPFRPRDAAGFGDWLERTRYAVIDAGAVRQIPIDSEQPVAAAADGWLGYRNRFWALMAAPPRAAQAGLLAAEGQRDAEVVVDAPPDGTWAFYLGPVEPAVLKQAAPELGGLLYAGLWFWLRWICLGLFHLLALVRLAIPSWGLAIMALSLAVNVLMLPLSRIADRLQQQVHETEARLAPELKRIKRNYRGEEQSAKILALYKTERVHPLYSLKSLAGVAVVIPVFIGAFDMLAENIHLLNTGFLWIADLSRPDGWFRLPFQLPFFGGELNLLPFLMTGLSFLASTLHRPPALDAESRRRQLRNVLLLALAFFALFYTFPAGMVLYWTTNNLISVIKSLWARR